MSDELKQIITTVVGILVRWGLKFAGAFLAANGINAESAENVAIGLVVFAIGAIISLVMRKKDLNTEPG